MRTKGFTKNLGSRYMPFSLVVNCPLCTLHNKEFFVFWLPFAAHWAQAQKDMPNEFCLLNFLNWLDSNWMQRNAIFRIRLVHTLFRVWRWSVLRIAKCKFIRATCNFFCVSRLSLWRENNGRRIRRTRTHTQAHKVARLDSVYGLSDG